MASNLVLNFFLLSKVKSAHWDNETFTEMVRQINANSTNVHFSVLDPSSSGNKNTAEEHVDWTLDSDRWVEKTKVKGTRISVPPGYTGRVGV